MLEFIEVNSVSEELSTEVYYILKECGIDMYQNQGLKHWKNPYPIENIQNDILEKRMFLVKLDGVYVGTFSLTDKPSQFFNDDERYIYLSKFAVLPQYSGQKIGFQSLNYIEELVKINSFKGIRLDVYNKSYIAINFYKKYGFNILHSAQTKKFTVLCMEKKVI